MVLKSTVAVGAQIDLTSVVVNEITLVGSRCGRFNPALDYLATGVDLSPLIAATYPIEDGLAAFEKASESESLKVMINF